MDRFVKYLSMSVSFIIFVLIIKYFYFDTKIGFDTEIVELNYSAFPMFIDVIIFALVSPLLVYGITIELLDKIINVIHSIKSKVKSN